MILKTIDVGADVIIVKDLSDAEILKSMKEINKKKSEEGEDDKENNELKPTGGEVSKTFTTIQHDLQKL